MAWRRVYFEGGARASSTNKGSIELMREVDAALQDRSDNERNDLRCWIEDLHNEIEEIDGYQTADAWLACVLEGLKQSESV